MFCVSCGAALPDDAAFCPVCGARIRGESGPETARLYSMRCTSCGSGDLRKMAGGKFRCAHCGSVLYAAGQNPGENSEAVQAKVALLLSEAAEYAEKQDDQSEIQALAKAMELAPEDNTVLLRLGRAYWRLGSIEKAMEYYRSAEKLYPNDPVVYTNIGSAFFKLGHYAEAKAQYEKAIALIESDPVSACGDDIGITYGNYAYCLGKLGDRKNARKYLTIAREKGYSRESIDTICKELHLIRFLI